MADPFEVRMRFTSQLQTMNASTNSAQKAAHYALKYRDMQEDLHSCILEQLERTSMNTRANIMYFIEHLCDMAKREDQLDFVRMMQRDIFRVVDAVAPSDGSGAANVKVARRVLNGLQQKTILAPEVVTKLETSLKERDTQPETGSISLGIDGVPGAIPPQNPIVLLGRLEKRQIEQRIEEDRERHKRLKESIWGVPADTADECRQMFEDCSDIGEDDYLVSAEEEAERAKVAMLG